VHAFIHWFHRFFSYLWLELAQKRTRSEFARADALLFVELKTTKEAGRHIRNERKPGQVIRFSYLLLSHTGFTGA